MHAHLELLQQMPIFGGIREDSLTALLGGARTVTRRSREFFFEERDPADSMFVLESGRASVIKSWRRRAVVLHRFSDGDCFGEMALMDFSPRSASVRADTDCLAIEIGAADLLHLFEYDMEQFAIVQMNIGREVCRRLRVTDDALFRATMGARPTSSKTLRRSG